MFCTSANRKYAWHIVGLSLLYAVFLVISVNWLQRTNPGAPWKYAIAIFPVLPSLLIPVVVARSIREMDELQRKIEFEGLAFGFCATAVLSLGYGFLGNAGVPQLNWIWVWVLMMFCWGFGGMLARRRYS